MVSFLLDKGADVGAKNEGTGDPSGVFNQSRRTMLTRALEPKEPAGQRFMLQPSRNTVEWCDYYLIEELSREHGTSTVDHQSTTPVSPKPFGRSSQVVTALLR